MGAQVVLAIDQGTTNSKAVFVSQAGKIVAQGASSLPINFPRPGWVEQDATDIWRSVLSAIAECITQRPDSNIVAIGISNQRESVMAWDRVTGDPLGPVLSWQCRRTTDATNALKSSGIEQKIVAATGLPLDPLFPALKINWLLQHAEQCDDLCVGTVDSWLIYKLTGGMVHATDRSNASRTQLLNIATGEWDSELCDLFAVPSGVLPTVCDSSNIFGTTRTVPGIPDGLPIASAIGDSHAALFGHSAFCPGDAKITFGTGSSIMVNLPQISAAVGGLTTTIAWSLNGDPTYAFEGNILVSAAIFPWSAEMLGLGEGAVDELMTLAQSVESSEGVFLVPAHVGLGSPHWQPEATGLISGLRFTTKPAHIARAAAESTALQLVDILESISNQIPYDLGTINVDGGPTKNRFLMQLVANLLGRPIHTCGIAEVSALGAAALAGLAVGFWTSLDELAALRRNGETIEPDLDENERVIIIQGWKKAVTQCIV